MKNLNQYQCDICNTVLERFQNGEWCDANEVCELLGITFSEGLKMFDFSRTAEWNNPPLEGQKITCEFRIKDSKYKELDMNIISEKKGKIVSTEDCKNV